MLLEEAEASQALPKDARMGETAGKMKQFASWFTHGVPAGEAAGCHLSCAHGYGSTERGRLLFAAQRNPAEK